MFASSVRIISLSLINFYQLLLSPIFGGNCRFYPSCSEYCKECFHYHGFFMSCWLTFVRLSKCHPLGPSGFDPVPDRKKVSRK